MNEDGNGYMVLVEKSRLYLYRVADNFRELYLLESAAISSALEYGQAYRLTVTLDGERITASINGTSIEKSDTAYSHGQIWLGSAYAKGE